jgi:hypothetical protein
MSDAAACILGIDPGLSGACAYYFPSAPDRVAAEDMPVVAGAVDCATLAARIAQMAPSLAVVERVASMPKQGVASTFKFGASYGAVLGVLAALKIQTHRGTSFSVAIVPTTGGTYLTVGVPRFRRGRDTQHRNKHCFH